MLPSALRSPPWLSAPRQQVNTILFMNNEKMGEHVNTQYS